MATIIAPKQIEMKKVIMWLVALGIPAAIMVTPTNEVFTGEVRGFFAITVCAILMFAFELMDNTIPAFLLPVMYIVSGLAPASVAFAPWTTTIPWSCIGGLILAKVLERNGLLKRVAFFCIIKTGGSYNGILYGIMIAGIIGNLAAPGQLSIPFAALTYGVCIALNLGKSRESAGIMLTGALAALLPGLFIYAPGNIGVILGAASAVEPMSVTWMEYFTQNLIYIPWCFLMVFVASKIFKPHKLIQGKDYFVQEYNKLGKLSIAEKKSIIVILILFTFFMTSSIHKIEMGWGFVLIPALLFFPGFNVGTKADIMSVNYPFIFFITACMSIGTVSNVLGVGQLISDQVLPFMDGAGLYGFVLIIWLLGVVVNFLLTPLAAMATLGAPLTQIALDLGLNPYPIMYIFYNALDQIIMPYEYALYLIFFSFGMIHLKDFMKLLGAKMFLSIIFILACVIPYYKLIGLL